MIPEMLSQNQREESAENGNGWRNKIRFRTIKYNSANSKRMRFVTCEPTERPVEVKINAVMAKKKAVARAAISPKNFMGRASYGEMSTEKCMAFCPYHECTCHSNLRMLDR